MKHFVILLALALSGCKSLVDREPEMEFCRLKYAKATETYVFQCVNNKTGAERNLEFNEYYKTKPICLSLDEYLRATDYQAYLYKNLRKCKLKF